MANWYYKKGDTEIGPVTGVSIKQLVLAQTITELTPVRRDDMTNWIAAGKIKNLFPVQSYASADSKTPPPVLPPSAGDSMESAANRMLSGLKSAAVVAAKGAQLKQIEWNRASADERLGAKAYTGRHGESENTERFARIAEIESIVKDLRQPELALEGESATDKAKRFAAEARKKLQVESLISERRKLLRDLGAYFRDIQTDLVPSELHGELATAVRHEQEAKKLQREIAEIDSPIKNVLAKSRTLGKAVVAVFLVLMLGFFTFRFFRSDKQSATGDTDSPDQEETVAALERESELEALRIEAEIAQIENEAEKENAKREAARRIEDRQEELEIAKRKAKAERQARQQEADAAIAERERMAESDERSAETQIARAKLADRFFGPITLDPSKSVLLSQSLKTMHGASVELRGKHYDTISTLHHSKDWLQLINVLGESSYSELPEARTIESAAFTLENTVFQMLLRTNSALTIETTDDRSRRLHLISFPLRYDRGVIDWEYNFWERHPEAIGYYRDWTPAHGYSILVVGDRSTVDDYVSNINNRYNVKKSAVDDRERLGEIDSKLAAIEISTFRSSLIAEAVSWALGQ